MERKGSLRAKNISGPILQEEITPAVMMYSPSLMMNESPRIDDNNSHRNSLATGKPPVMNKVWLDEDDEKTDEEIEEKELRDKQDLDKKKGRRESQSFLLHGLRRFGSQRGEHKRSKSTNNFQQPQGYHKHSNSKLSLSSFTQGHSRTRSIMSFIAPKNEEIEDNKKVEISAPSNFVHANHIDAEYIRGSSADKSISRANSTSKNPPGPPIRPYRPKYNQHKHDNSLGSLLSTTSSSSKSGGRPVSTLSYNTPMTSASPSPALTVDKKPSTESFGCSWATSPNTGDFLEQQKWLMHTMNGGEAASPSILNNEPTARTTSNAESYYYSNSPATSAYACYSPNAGGTTISSRRYFTQADDRERKSVLLPTPNLPVSQHSTTTSTPQGLGIHSHHVESKQGTRRFLGTVDEQNDFQWF